jgi:tetratricopeptide (TPR) repeat protein
VDDMRSKIGYIDSYYHILDLIQDKILQLSSFIFNNPLSYKSAGLEALLTFIDSYEKAESPRTVRAIDNDIIRFGYFSIGNAYYKRNDYNQAKGYYTRSMTYSKYNRYLNYYHFKDYLDSDLKLEKGEIEKYAFSQFIAYNLCCAYAKLREYGDAIGWLKVSIRISREIIKIESEDNDLIELREYIKTNGIDLL